MCSMRLCCSFEAPGCATFDRAMERLCRNPLSDSVYIPCRFGIGNVLIAPRAGDLGGHGRIVVRPRLGGLLNFYRRKAG